MDCIDRQRKYVSHGLQENITDAKTAAEQDEGAQHSPVSNKLWSNISHTANPQQP